MQETWVWSLGWEDALEKGIATHSSILTWRIPWTEEPGGFLQSMGSQRVGHDWETNKWLTMSYGKYMHMLLIEVHAKYSGKFCLLSMFISIKINN